MIALMINFANLQTSQYLLIFLWNDGHRIMFKQCLWSHLSVFLLFNSLVHTKMQPFSNNLYYLYVPVSWISAEKPYSNSCNPRRWRGPSIQPLRMHQCPQIPAQSQNTDGGEPRGNFTLRYNFVQKYGFLSRSSNWLLSEREEENILKYEFGFDTVEKPRTCLLNADWFAY